MSPASIGGSAAEHGQPGAQIRPPSPRGSRSQFSLEEKLRIVGEALCDGVRQAHITRKYGLGKNTLARWKQMLGPLCAVDSAVAPDRSSSEVERLVSRVAELERLLGQRTLELDVLRQRLQRVRATTTWTACATGIAPERSGPGRLDGS